MGHTLAYIIVKNDSFNNRKIGGRFPMTYHNMGLNIVIFLPIQSSLQIRSFLTFCFILFSDLKTKTLTKIFISSQNNF
jgi:hypothetical protein